MRFLALRLEGPLMSFGDVAVDELRYTDLLPGLSMITGLLANALGVTYRQVERLQRLQECLVMGSRLENRGDSLVDYQNAHLERSDLLWRRAGLPPAGRTGGQETYLGPVQRWRHYRADTRVSLVVGLEPEGEPWRLEDLAAALRHPFRPLFLGRVCCPPGAPLYRGEQLTAQGVRQALERLPRLPGAEEGALLAEWPDGHGGESGADGDYRILERYDLRDWLNDVHTGSRRVVRGMVDPPPPPPTVALAQEGGGLGERTVS